MRYYFLEFIKKNYNEKSDAYLFILWSVLKNLKNGGRLSNSIKDELEIFNLNDLQNKKEKGLRILSNIESEEKESDLSTFPYIKSIQIKDFRGFGSLNEQDLGCNVELDRKKNIFFGPNGSGKTSLCEAFEYKLTSKIKEAKRRNVPLKEYIKRDNKNPKVDLVFSDDQFDTKNLNDYEMEFFQMCFIEKNRLQEFALLGSKDTGVKEKDVIASLLGMQDLDNLISSFVKPSSFTLESYLRNDVFNKLEQLKQDNEKNLTTKNEIRSEKLEIYNSLVDNYEIEIEEVDEKKIQELISLKEAEKESLEFKVKKLEHNKLIVLDQNIIDDMIYSIQQNVMRLKELEDKLIVNATEINYETFYNALNDLDPDKIEKCPACDTPFEDVFQDPFEKAHEELVKLKEITDIKNQVNDIKRELETNSYVSIEKLVDNFESNLDNYDELRQEGLVRMIKELKKLSLKGDRRDYVERFLSESKKIGEEFKIYFEKQKKLNATLKESSVEIEKDTENINVVKSQITDLRIKLDRIEKINRTLIKIEKNLENYHSHYKKLNEEKKYEDAYNNFLREVETTYKDFYNDLIRFKIKLEEDRITNVEDKVLKFYQLINCYDNEAEYITEIKFKLENDNYRIYLSKTDDSLEVDAYTCLSEGHLRALGLSLMLAVAEKNRVPFIIFDDVVNAIDSDHRANIIDMMFNNTFLQDVQQIITTHDRLFWERFCNINEASVGRSVANDVSYIFNYTNKGTVLTQYNVGFESKIKNALDNYDIRQALIYCRIWFETIVTNYCCEKRKKLTATFSKDKKSNYLKPSLESIYSVLLNDFNDNENLSIIKNDLIHWEGQNQEHHTFDENSYNFVHSKNSDEVSKIYYAIRRFINDMNPEESLRTIRKRIEYVENRLQRANFKLQSDDFLQKAPQNIVEAEKMFKKDLEKEYTDSQAEIERLTNDIQYTTVN